MFSESCVPFETKTTGKKKYIYIYMYFFPPTMVRFGSICETAKLTLRASLKDMGKEKKKSQAVFCLFDFFFFNRVASDKHLVAG